MSRIGEKTIQIEDEVNIVVDGQNVNVTGPKGNLTCEIDTSIEIKQDANELRVLRKSENREVRARQGLYRALIANMVTGVTKGFEKQLELNGIGYRVQLQGKDLLFSIGYSHPVVIKPRKGIEFVVEGQNKVKVTGIDKQLVGQVAAELREIRSPDPYKGKGIKYADEVLIKKQGKSVKK
ncbi:MAG: 50S ribosomal protein L6 [bacterium]|nr:50S ribosomal protein L6 [bacterium]